MNKGIKIALIVMVIGFAFSFVYPKVPILKQSIHAVLNPTFGTLLNYNATIGLIIITAIMSLILTLVQKYTTNQEELRKLRAEQKILQEEMKKYKDHPEKLMEFQKKQLEFIPKTFELTSRPLLYKVIHFVLFLRWFGDYFLNVDYKFFGFLSWVWFYLLGSIIINMILRKILKVH